MIHTAFIGVGSNLDSPREKCAEAIQRISKLSDCCFLSQSFFYQTAPIGDTDQEWFVNAALQIETDLDPLQLLEALVDVEQAMGRTFRRKWGPREIDLDLLFFDDRILQSEHLQLPHPELHKRRFVLEPLNDLAPEWIHPELRVSIQQLLRELPPGQETLRMD